MHSADKTGPGDLYDLLVIGGRSGVGKSSVGFEIAAQLEAADVPHAYLEGDCMDWVYPQRPGLAEKNIAAIWQNYAAAGYRRLIYTNTASIGSAADITGAMGGRTRVVGALLTCTDETARGRLTGREIGSTLDWHLTRSEIVGREFAAATLPSWATRVSTDGRKVADIAAEIVALTGWRNSTRDERRSTQ
jgi:hypothetical protein